MQWEYRVTYYGTMGYGQDACRRLESYLNQHEERGWELVSFADVGGNRWVMVQKRPKDKPE